MSTRDRVILAVLFIGFLTLAVETRFEHRDVIQEKWQAWIPPVYSALAALASLVALPGKKGVRTVAAAVFFLGILVGGYGLYMHTGFDPAVFTKFLNPEARVMGSKLGPDGQPMQVFIQRPVVAPMSVTGLAAIGFLLTSGLFKHRG